MSTWKTLPEKMIVEQDHQSKTLVRPVNVTDKLKKLRERAGLSQAAIAKKLGMKGQSSYQRYEDAVSYKKDYLSQELVEKLIPILTGRGDPPIAKSELLSLAGLSKIDDGFVPVAIAQSIVGEKTPKLIPVLGWGQIVMWVKQQLKLPEIEKFTDASHEDPSDTAFVLPVRDNSMTPDGINPGDRIVCDPTKPCDPGDVVIASVSSVKDPIIGIYRLRRGKDGEEITEIAPSNDAYLPHFIDSQHPGNVIGPIVEIRKTFKRSLKRLS